MKYAVCDREAGNIITYCETAEEAEDLIKSFEEEDIRDNVYEYNFYGIRLVD